MDVTMKVLVCGARDYSNRLAVSEALDALDAEHRISVVIEGGADGADALAREWARERAVPRLTFYAEWEIYGRSAGPIRNRRMLDDGRPDMVLAFPGGRGTRNMVRQATARGVPVRFTSTKGA